MRQWIVWVFGVQQLILCHKTLLLITHNVSVVALAMNLPSWMWAGDFVNSQGSCLYIALDFPPPLYHVRGTFSVLFVRQLFWNVNRGVLNILPMLPGNYFSTTVNVQCLGIYFSVQMKNHCQSAIPLVHWPPCIWNTQELGMSTAWLRGSAHSQTADTQTHWQALNL